MKLKGDYHIHSVYSKNNHGKSTIEEIVLKSIELGLKEIAITDHGPSHYMYGIKRSNIVKAKNEVDDLRKKYPQIRILFGIEANILNYDGDIDVDKGYRDLYDIILCGYHIGVLFSGIGDFWKFYGLNFFSSLSNNLKMDIIEKNTQAVVNALNKNKINILTHPGDKIPVDINKIAKAAEKNDTILEISNSHGHLNADEIKIAAKYDVRFAINSDSHIKDTIGGFQNGLNEAIRAGLDLRRIINME